MTPVDAQLEELVEKRERLRQAHRFANTADLDAEIASMRERLEGKPVVSIVVGAATQATKFIASNGWDFFAGKILESLCLWVETGKADHLLSADFFTRNRIHLDAEDHWPNPRCRDKPGAAMNDFIRENGIPDGADIAFLALELWVMSGRRSTSCRSQFVEALEFLSTAVNGSQSHVRTINY